MRIATMFVFALLFIGSVAKADRFAITCQTLGDIGQCENVTICEERTLGTCEPLPGFEGTPCSVANASAVRCKSAFPNFCEWRSSTQCVPKNR